MVALQVESWVWYGVVLLVAGSRFVSRYLTLGSIKRLEADDWVMLAVLGFYTTLIVTINIVYFTSSNLLPPGFDVNTLTAADISAREYGSKLILVVEQCQCVTVWGAKACLIILYMRITSLTGQHLWIKILAGYVAFGFVFMEIFYFGVWCRPFYEYWAVPTPNVQCDAATNHLITNCVFNLTSDVAMLALGLPMFLRLNMPLKKKVPLVGIFSLGIFVILAAILNKVYSFTEPFGSLWTYWYVRESSTALLVANLPFVWTFWRKLAGAPATIIAGASRQASMATDSAQQRRPTMQRKGSDLPSLPKPYRLSSLEGSADTVEMEEGRARRTGNGALTLADMLGETETISFDEKSHISPYTHPRLFFASRQVGQADSPSSPQKAVVHDTEEVETIRRGSSLEDLAVTPSRLDASQSISSHKSAAEYV